MKKTITYITILVALTALLSSNGYSEPEKNEKNEKNLYVTWEGAEPDKGASAWLIKTFINKDSVFKYIKKGAIVKTGIAFDVPFSEFRRTHRYTTFDTLRLKYRLKSKALLNLGKIIFDLEINTWRKPLSNKTPYVKQAFDDLRQLFKLNFIPLDCQVAFFNVIFTKLKEGKNLHITPPQICMTLAKSNNKKNTIELIKTNK